MHADSRHPTGAAAPAHADEEHLRLVLAGAPAAVEAFVANLERLTLGIARGRFRFAQADAEDILLEVFEKLWRDDRAALRQWSGRSSLNTYLTVVVSSFCLMEKRRRKNAPFVETDDEIEPAVEPRAFDTLERQDRRALLDRGLAALTEEDRGLVTRRYLQGQTYEQIERATGRSYGALRKAMHVALKRLEMQVQALAAARDGPAHDPG